MPTYKLNYFDVRARGEIVRLIFTYAGVPFEDCRFPHEEWPAVKSKMPFGQMPVLEVDGVQIAQTNAIASFLARRFDLYGKDDFEKATIDQIACLIQDYLTDCVKIFYEKDEARKAEMNKKLIEETIPKFLGFFEKVLKRNNDGNGYFIGNAVTLADLLVYDLLWGMQNTTPGVLDNNPLLKQHLERIGAIDKIKAYVAARKPTNM